MNLGLQHGRGEAQHWATNTPSLHSEKYNNSEFISSYVPPCRLCRRPQIPQTLTRLYTLHLIVSSSLLHPPFFFLQKRSQFFQMTQFLQADGLTQCSSTVLFPLVRSQEPVSDLGPSKITPVLQLTHKSVTHCTDNTQITKI